MRSYCPYQILFLVLIGLLCLPAAGAELSASPSGEVGIDVDGDSIVSLSLTGADAGISGFNITLAVSNPTVVSIAKVSIADWVILPVNCSTPDGQEMYVTGVDLNQQVQPGGYSFFLFTVELKGLTAGTATLTVTPRRIEDDVGSRYPTAPLQISILVGNVASSPTTVPATVTLSDNTGSRGSSSELLILSPAPITATSTIEMPTTKPADSNKIVLPEASELYKNSTTERPLNATTTVTTSTLATALSWSYPIAVLVGLCTWHINRLEANR